MHLGNIALGITLADFTQQTKVLNKTGGSRTTLLSVISKIQAAQDDAGRRALEFPCDKLLSGTLFNLIAQSHELHFALVRLVPLRLFQVVHGGCADGAGYFPLAVNHRKQDHHPVKFVTAKAAGCQCHLASPLKDVPRSSGILIDREMRCAFLIVTRRAQLFHF